MAQNRTNRRAKIGGKKFRYDALKSEAARTDGKVLTPFILEVDGEDDIVVPPMDTERGMDLLELLDDRGDVQIRHTRKALQAMCGDQYPRVWELVRHDSIEETAAVAATMARHLITPQAIEADELPGGSEAS